MEPQKRRQRVKDVKNDGEWPRRRRYDGQELEVAIRTGAQTVTVLYFVSPDPRVLIGTGKAAAVSNKQSGYTA